MARVSQQFTEPVVEGADEGRVSGVLAEVAVTESDQARVSGVLAEVAVTESDQARVSGVLAEVTAAESYNLHAAVMFVETFCVPTSAKDQVRLRQGINTVQGSMSNLQGNKWKLLPGQRG